MSYPRITDHSFAYSFPVPEATAQEIAAFLISAEGMGPAGLGNGSSFAVTARENEGLRRVWLSLASFDRLRDLGRYDDLLRTAMMSEEF